jgi:hypothetical protein
LRSCRVNQDIRISLHQLGDTLMLCYVDHHQTAYQWAESRKIDVHAKTGAAQIVEVVEKEVIRTIVREITRDPPLFASHDVAYVEAIGVPSEWVNAVHHVDQRGLETLIGRLPDEAMERLMDLAAGNPVPVPAVRTGINLTCTRMPNDVSAFSTARMKCVRHWRTHGGVDRLPASEPAPDVVQKPYNGPADVSGSAGTGKTVIALHRAVALARRIPESSVLVTSFSRTLAVTLGRSLDLLAG